MLPHFANLTTEYGYLEIISSPIRQHQPLRMKHTRVQQNLVRGWAICVTDPVHILWTVACIAARKASYFIDCAHTNDQTKIVKQKMPRGLKNLVKYRSFYKTITVSLRLYCINFINLILNPIICTILRKQFQFNLITKSILIYVHKKCHNDPRYPQQFSRVDIFLRVK